MEIDFHKNTWTQHSSLFSLFIVYELVCISIDIAVRIMEDSSLKLRLVRFRIYSAFCSCFYIKSCYCPLSLSKKSNQANIISNCTNLHYVCFVVKLQEYCNTKCHYWYNILLTSFLIFQCNIMIWSTFIQRHVIAGLHLAKQKNSHSKLFCIITLWIM